MVELARQLRRPDPDRRPVALRKGAAVEVAITGMPKLSWLRLIASGQHPSVVTKHDQPTRILPDAGSVDRSGDLEVGVTIENLLDTRAFTASLKSSIEYLEMSVGIHRTLHGL
jgi:hypothetical protein